MEILGFYVLMGVIAVVATRFSAHSTRLRMESLRVQIETNADVLTHRLQMRVLDDAKEEREQQRLLGDGK